jgi:arylsulfatase A-like enzyme
MYPSVHRAGSGTHERRSVRDGTLSMVSAPADAPRTTAILSPGIVTVAEVFRNAGYRTLGLVANNLIGADDGYGQGFERYENFDDRAIAGRAIAWLEEHVDEPVLVYLHFMAPHAPYDPPREYDLFTDDTPHLDIHHTASKDSINFTRTRTLNARDVEVLINQYDGEVRFADHTVGRVLAALDDSRRRDDTLVMLTSDHGEEFMEHGMVWHEPTRFYQALTRVPLIVEAPGVAPTRVAETVMSIDIAPTALDYAGLAAPEAMQGRSFLPVGTPRAPRAAFTEGLDWGLGHAVWRGSDKLHYDREVPALELYDLSTDPGERADLSEVAVDRRAALLDSLEYRWRANGARRNSMGAVSGEVTDDQLERLKSLGYVQ